MRKVHIAITALAFVILVFLTGPIGVRAQVEKAPYPAMAPLDQYLIADEKAEIAPARSAAPASVSDGAEVMVLGPAGYMTAAKGSNGFVCLVERSWGTPLMTHNSGIPKCAPPIASTRPPRALFYLSF